MNSEQKYIDEVLATVNRYIKYAAEMSKEFTTYQDSLALEKIFDPRVLIDSVQRTTARKKVESLIAMFNKYKNF